MLEEEEYSPGEKKLLNSRLAEQTKQHYIRYLRMFRDNFGYEVIDQLLVKEPREIEDQIIDFITSCKNKNMRGTAIPNYINPVIKFCRVNRVILNSDYINEQIPARKKGKKTGAYTHEQIQKMLEVSDERMRVIILLSASSGVRVGAIPLLRFGNLKETEFGYKITVYEGEKEEYSTFCTPECRQAIIDYKEMRERYGEKITSKSPLIREQFDKRDSFSAKNPRNITEMLLKKLLTGLAESVGLRTRVKLSKGQRPASVRSDVPSCNGFRRFFTSQCINANLNSEKRWLLEGHNLKADDNSYAHLDDTLEKEYLKAIDDLTINPENRLQRRLNDAEAKVSEMDELRLALTRIEKELGLVSA